LIQSILPGKQGGGFKISRMEIADEWNHVLVPDRIVHRFHHGRLLTRPLSQLGELP
jgi:hypothetical protein